MNKVLVAYFSASGTTANAAQRLAEAAGTDIFEIVAEQPYTKEDLKWTDQNSRSSNEVNERSRPAIRTRVENMESYDIIFLGFPIWWYREPPIIDTFIESYDFTGKTIVPFCTSGGSGIGSTSDYIRELINGAKVLEGKKFPFIASDRELKNWVEGIS